MDVAFLTMVYLWWKAERKKKLLVYQSQQLRKLDKGFPHSQGALTTRITACLGRISLNLFCWSCPTAYWLNIYWSRRLDPGVLYTQKSALTMTGYYVFVNKFIFLSNILLWNAHPKVEQENLWNIKNTCGMGNHIPPNSTHKLHSWHLFQLISIPGPPQQTLHFENIFYSVKFIILNTDHLWRFFLGFVLI